MASVDKSEPIANSLLGDRREPRMEQRRLQCSRMAPSAERGSIGHTLPAHCGSARWSIWCGPTGVAGEVSFGRDFCFTGVLRFISKSPRQLWSGGGLYSRQRPGFWGRGFKRCFGRNRRRDSQIPYRLGPDRNNGLELWRLRNHVGGDANTPVPGGCSRRRDRQLAKLLWTKPYRPMDDPLLRRFSL